MRFFYGCILIAAMQMLGVIAVYAQSNYQTTFYESLEKDPSFKKHSTQLQIIESAVDALRMRVDVSSDDADRIMKVFDYLDAPLDTIFIQLMQDSTVQVELVHHKVDRDTLIKLFSLQRSLQGQLKKLNRLYAYQQMVDEGVDLFTSKHKYKAD